MSLSRTIGMPSLLLKAIRDAAQQQEGEEPEVWAAPIEQRFVAIGKIARKDAIGDVQKLAAQWQHGARIQAQRDELRSLIKQHYVCRLSSEQKEVFWAVPQGVVDKWREIGVLGPTTKSESLTDLTDDMATAARLTDILHRHISYAEMRKLAQKAPQLDIDKLALHIANETLATAIERLASRHGDVIADAAAMEQRRHLLSIVGNVKLTVGKGKNTRLNLAEHMAELLGGTDVSREWERAAVTTTRYAYNLGILTRLRNNNAKYIAYNVHSNACVHCKKLLLHDDGMARAFSLDTIWSQVADDGGLNIGRKASAIGKSDGWRVGIVIHPFCRCNPRTATKQEVARTFGA